jgi:hypothetical protein
MNLRPKLLHLALVLVCIYSQPIVTKAPATLGGDLGVLLGSLSKKAVENKGKSN